METKRFYGEGEITLSECGFMYLDGKDILKIICDKCLEGSEYAHFFGTIYVTIIPSSICPFNEVEEG